MSGCGLLDCDGNAYQHELQWGKLLDEHVREIKVIYDPVDNLDFFISEYKECFG